MLQYVFSDSITSTAVVLKCYFNFHEIPRPFTFESLKKVVSCVDQKHRKFLWYIYVTIQICGLDDHIAPSISCLIYSVPFYWKP